MVLLRDLSGMSAEGYPAIRRFPFHVGRAPDNELCLPVAGVWDYHFRLQLRPKEGVLLETIDAALATVNDQPVTSARLRNGDIIAFGSAKLQFWLAAPAQRGLRLRELLVWCLLGLVSLGEVVLIAYLLGLG